MCGERGKGEGRGGREGRVWGGCGEGVGREGGRFEWPSPHAVGVAYHHVVKGCVVDAQLSAVHAFCAICRGAHQ